MALEACGEVGMPVAEKKTMGPSTLFPQLGIELDSEERHMIRLNAAFRADLEW